MEPVWSIADVMRHFQISKSTVYRNVHRGMPHYYVGSRLRFKPAEVEAFLLKPRKPLAKPRKRALEIVRSFARD